MTSVVIVSAVRTPIGTFSGKLSSVPSYVLGSIVIEEVLQRANVEKSAISEILFGQVLTAGQGQNPARHASLLADIPHSVPSATINQVCGSSLRAVAMAYQAILCQDATIVVAGGHESMSLAPHCIHMRNPVRKGAASLVDSMDEDGLIDCIHKCEMGVTAEAVAQKWEVTRDDQDAFALASQMKAARAQKNGKFSNEIVPVTVKGRKNTETVVDTDEFPRPQTTMEGLAQLKPLFVTPEQKEKGVAGSVTVGNATGLNNGAAAVLVMTKEEADKRSLKPLARIVSWAQAGVDPMLMGTGPVPAVRLALAKANWKVEDIDLMELNEAFAAQSLVVIRELGVDPDKVNVNGGAIALGHPLGASGCRILVTLVHAMKDRDCRRGVASLCVGGGMGVAMCVERV